MSFITNRIIEARMISLENGQAKYRAYFIDLKIYNKYKTKVDADLITNGYGDCIVTE